MVEYNFSESLQKNKENKNQNQSGPSTKLGDTKTQYVKMEGNIETGTSTEKDSR